MSNENKRVVEIGGVKVEVDLRTAVQIHEFRVGDNVRLLQKDYSDRWKVSPGKIVEFCDFKNRPTIVVAYIDRDYNVSDVKFASVNADSVNTEIAPAGDDPLTLDRDFIVASFDNQILEKERETATLKAKRDFFIARFDCTMPETQEGERHG